jgi:hypothetical protein
VQFGRRTEASAQARLLRPDYPETGFEEISTGVACPKPTYGSFQLPVCPSSVCTELGGRKTKPSNVPTGGLQVILRWVAGPFQRAQVDGGAG